MIPSEEGFFPSFDGTQLCYRAWQTNHPNAFVILHGYGEHSGRYGEVVEFLKDLPYAFFAYDMRGQGKSHGPRVHIERFTDLLQDFDSFCEFLVRSKGGASNHITLFGHSLGGLLAVRIAERSGAKLRALILSSPCFQVAGIAAWPVVKQATRAMNRIAPRVVLTNFVTPRFLFHGEANLRRYLADSLIERKITPRFASAIYEECDRIQTEETRLDMPVFVQASGDDRVVSLHATKRWFERLRASDKRMEIYPELYHEIFQETSTDRPVTDLKLFLQKQQRGEP